MGCGLITTFDEACGSVLLGGVCFVSYMRWAIELFVVSISRAVPESHSTHFALDSYFMAVTFDGDCSATPDEAARSGTRDGAVLGQRLSRRK